MGQMVEDREALEQQLPHSIEAEQAVLGGLMLSNSGFDAVASLISDKDFFASDHQLIFQTMRQLNAEQKPLDIITLSEALQNNRQLDQIGGSSYLVELSNNTPSSANINAYAQIVLERSIIRQLITAASDIVKKGYNPLGWDSNKLLAEAEKRLVAIIESRPNQGGFLSVNELLKEVVERIDQLFNSDADITGLSTGFADLDEKTSGWQPSDLVIVAGRPSMGKTSFAMNMAEHAVLHQEKPVLVFSMEMPASQLIMRMMSSLGKIDQTKLRAGNLSEDDWPRLSSAASRLKDRPLFIDDTPGITPMELRNRVRQVTREHGQPGMILVDYLQLMSGSIATENRTNEISQISRELKNIAREFNCPVIALSQLSRNLENRPNKRPINSDLRESGAIEQDADVVVFIYRDEVYNEESPDKGVAEIIIGKQRNGPIGTCKLTFLGKYTRFENLARDYFAQD
ncbi:MAG: replicative DNA helicase [Porticoccus sp.]|uniref:replicative DNA helicase n=1 Tax=Porticoccus hydrocarbonoclasticus TaxID=1073414 RepID=UPI000560BF0B|nr:replicative DNA helicase [Porticoccus sp.]|tara:strand:+ start:6130 stop:7500 length:1371 start_codon:yes stop_codon:yes gene_type:complete